MVTLAFDQSTAVTGFSVWNNETLFDYGIIDLHKNDNTDERIKDMTNRISDIIQKYSPDSVVIEEVAQQSNAKVLKILARLQGAILYMCMLRSIPCSIIEPAKWRSKIGLTVGPHIKRSDLKHQAIQHVKEKYNLDVIEDVAEAICIGESIIG